MHNKLCPLDYKVVLYFLQNLFLFPDKGGKPEPQKGWRRHLVSEFALFKSTVTPEPQNAKPVFNPKDIHQPELIDFDGDEDLNIVPAPVVNPDLKKPEKLKAQRDNSELQTQNTRPARLEKITHLEKPRKSTKNGKDKKKLKKETPRDESPENWVIPSLATAFALPDILNGSDRPPKFSAKKPKVKDIKDWVPEFTTHNPGKPAEQVTEQEMKTSTDVTERPSSGQRPKSPYRVKEGDELTNDDKVSYSLYPETKTPML